MRLPDYIQAIDHRVRTHIPSAPWTCSLNAEDDAYILRGPHGEEIAYIPLNGPESLLIANFLSQAREDITVLLHELSGQARRIQELEEAASTVFTEIN